MAGICSEKSTVAWAAPVTMNLRAKARA
jgi:hypothetical protein